MTIFLTWRMAGSRSAIELRIFSVERLLHCALLEPLMKGLLKEPGEGLLGRGSRESGRQQDQHLITPMPGGCLA
jgi:hypothetical protein